MRRDIKQLIKYWQVTSERDYETMLYLFKTKRYPETLFFGHIILEKILKAQVVKITKEEAPKTHDLVRLAELGRLDLIKEKVEYLKIVNRFNMRTRYPDAKLKFYKQCTRTYTVDNLNKIKKLYKELCQKLKQKR